MSDEEVTALQARVEELARVVQYLMDCPCDPKEMAKRRAFADQMLDQKVMVRGKLL